MLFIINGNMYRYVRIYVKENDFVGFGGMKFIRLKLKILNWKFRILILNFSIFVISLIIFSGIFLFFSELLFSMLKFFIFEIKSSTFILIFSELVFVG